MREKRRVFLATPVSKSWRKQVQEKLFLFIISSGTKMCLCMRHRWRKNETCGMCFSLQFTWPPIFTFFHLQFDFEAAAHTRSQIHRFCWFWLAFSVVTSCLPLQANECLWTGDFCQFWCCRTIFDVSAQKISKSRGRKRLKAKGARPNER